MATRILLLRHAQSTWNAEGRWQGWADPPLTADGEAAAAAVADDPALDVAEAIVSSDLVRAHHTAEVIATARRWPPVRAFRGLRERGAGRWTGLTRVEIEAGWPGALHTAGRPPQIDGGEAPAAVVARAVATLHRIAECWPDAAVVAITHGALIRMVETHLGAPPAPIPNLSGRWIDVGTAVSAGPAAALPSDTALTQQAG